MRRSTESGPSPVSDRLLVLQFLRLLNAAALLAIPAAAGVETRAVALIALVYLMFVAVIDVARRMVPSHSVAVVSWSVLVDGAAVALAVALTGGYRSPLLFLVFLDVMAVTLIASYRTGLKLAAWCALLVLLAYAAVDAGVVDGPSALDDRGAIVSAIAFLIFAVCAAAFSAVNERALRHSRGQLEQLVVLGTELERALRTDDVLATLVHHTCARLGFTRAVALMRSGPVWDGVGGAAPGGAPPPPRPPPPPGPGAAGPPPLTRRGHTCGGGGGAGGGRGGGGGRPRGRAHLHVSDRSAPLVDEAWASSTPMLVRVVDDDLLDLVLPAARNVVIASITVDGEHLGIAAAEWGGGMEARIATSTVSALAQASMHTALALRNARLLTENERLATRDALTGLANRRLFDESLRREMARSERLGSPLSLLVLDVDHFKQVNDTYGHQTGDAVLREVADALVANTKNFDVPARYGGDEFVVLLPGCSRDDGIRVAERVRNRVAQAVGEAPVTISAGVATVPDNATDPERLMAAADTALYDAKRTGRDRVASSGRNREAVPDLPPLHWTESFARGR